MNARVESPLGLITDMPAEEYHSTHALSAGGLKRLRQSPMHFWAHQIDPNRTPSTPTAAMKAGTLAHCALLEPWALRDRYVIRPEGLDGRTKEGKAWLAAVPAGSIAVSFDEMETAAKQAQAVHSLPEIAAFMNNGRAETSAFWIDEATGELCKCRPDWTSDAGDGVVIIDLKTCQDASLSGFPKTIANFGYHLQAAWYADGYEKATGRMVIGFVFACVESAAPHAAAAYMLDDSSMEKARAENRRLLELYASCKDENRWPGYTNTIQVLSLPAWAL